MVRLTGSRVMVYNPVQAVRSRGATENAGLENAGPLAMEHRSDSVVKQKFSLFLHNDLTKSNVSEQKNTNTMCPLTTKK